MAARKALQQQQQQQQGSGRSPDSGRTRRLSIASEEPGDADPGHDKRSSSKRKPRPEYAASLKVRDRLGLAYTRG